MLFQKTQEAEKAHTQTMEGIIFQTIPQPLRNFQMKSAVVFLWMFISYKTGGKLNPPLEFPISLHSGCMDFLVNYTFDSISCAKNNVLLAKRLVQIA